MAWPVLFLLGISAGAGLVVVLLVSLGLWQVWVPFGAWLGAIATTLMVYLLARTGTTISVERLILGGVAFSSLFGAVQSMLLLMTQDGRVQAALTWLIGSLKRSRLAGSDGGGPGDSAGPGPGVLTIPAGQPAGAGG